MNEPTPIALTIAGSDSGGGAGIQADLKTFEAFRVFGTSVVTAVTAQNTIGVHAVHPIPVQVVRAQIDSVVTDLPPAALKTGMLSTRELVLEVVDAIRHHGLESLVVDPVMVATSGDPLLEPDAEQVLIDELLPLAAVVTPNMAEAARLTGRPVTTLSEMRDAARALVHVGCDAALVKGGHLEDEAVDVLWDGSEEHLYRRKRLDTRHTHGTGCTLSAAIAARLAHSDPLSAAVDAATQYVGRAIAEAPGLGAGHGPLNHGVSAD